MKNGKTVGNRRKYERVREKKYQSKKELSKLQRRKMKSNFFQALSFLIQS